VCPPRGDLKTPIGLVTGSYLRFFDFWGKGEGKEEGEGTEWRALEGCCNGENPSSDVVMEKTFLEEKTSLFGRKKHGIGSSMVEHK
jgi:hypothetical protein